MNGCVTAYNTFLHKHVQVDTIPIIVSESLWQSILNDPYLKHWPFKHLQAQRL